MKKKLANTQSYQEVGVLRVDHTVLLVAMHLGAEPQQLVI